MYSKIATVVSRLSPASNEAIDRRVSRLGLDHAFSRWVATNSLAAVDVGGRTINTRLLLSILVIIFLLARTTTAQNMPVKQVAERLGQISVETGPTVSSQTTNLRIYPDNTSHKTIPLYDTLDQETPGKYAPLLSDTSFYLRSGAQFGIGNGYFEKMVNAAWTIQGGASWPMLNHLCGWLITFEMGGD